jgi:hypothetical protein
MLPLLEVPLLRLLLLQGVGERFEGRLLWPRDRNGSRLRKLLGLAF